jgi:hypothetical protein
LQTVAHCAQLLQHQQQQQLMLQKKADLLAMLVAAVCVVVKSFPEVAVAAAAAAAVGGGGFLLPPLKCLCLMTLLPATHVCCLLPHVLLHQTLLAPLPEQLQCSPCQRLAHKEESA